MRSTILVLILLVTLTSAAADRPPRALEAADLDGIDWRSIGPAAMGGRVSALALVPGSRTAFYVGFATGGVFFTDNLGTTFKPVFGNKETASIGAIAVADAPADWPGWEKLDNPPSADERTAKGKGRVVWVGTGEGNNRNSSSWGHGVYRSTDGGGSFTHLGLAETHDIPALAVDPRDPDVAYVAALGHLWGANPERGLYQTTDGGATWRQELAKDSDTGACDVVLDPSQPDRVYAALYARRRTAWSYSGVSEKGGILRSEDGGHSWARLTTGLPARTGRIGLAVAPDPRILFAVVESDQGGSGTSPWDDRSPAGGMFRSDDRGESWRRVNALDFRPFYFSRLAVDPSNAERVYASGWDLTVSEDGGRTLRRLGARVVHVDHHALVVNPLDPSQIIVGNDGGVYISHDRGTAWRHLDTIAAGQFYHVAVDDSDPYRVGGGLQDNGTWLGPSETIWGTGDKDEEEGGIGNEEWQMVHGGDGFGFAFDPTDSDVVYATSQGGELARVHLKSRLVERLKPAPEEGQERLRFNWDAPFFVSRHDPTVLYLGGNKVYKLTHKGRYWYAISPDLSRRQVDRIMTEGSDAETSGTVVALAESPLEKGLLWAGTDDGRIHVATTEGDWRDITPPEVGQLYVAHLEPSAHDAATAYAAVDGHRSDVFRPLILLTTDRGASWTTVSGDLPANEVVRVVREDPTDTRVLYCGTETGAWLTRDRGAHWVRLGKDSLPTVPVYDLAIHPRERDLIAATHGRSLWILDDAGCLAELAGATLEEPVHLCAPPKAVPRLRANRGYGSGDAVFRGANPPAGVAITYWLRERQDKVKVRVEDAAGNEVRSLEGGGRPGLNRVVWDLRPDEKLWIRSDDQGRFGVSRFVPPGKYTVVVTAGEHTARGTLEAGPAPDSWSAEEVAFIPPVVPAA